MTALLRTSTGIGLCLAHGTCSGQVMDYVARNQASGTGRLGRWLDAWFLRYPGWEAVRARRATLLAILEPLLRGSRHLQVVDVACGTGEILQEAVRRSEAEDAVVWGVDLDADALERARRGVPAGTTATYVAGDALAPGLAAGADLVLVSGLYELLPEPEVMASLADIAGNVKPGAHVVVAHQVRRPPPRGLAALAARWVPTDTIRPRDLDAVVALVQESGLVIDSVTLASDRYVVVVGRRAA